MQHFHHPHDPATVYALTRDLFLAASITCLLCALHRIARALTLRARVEALDELEDDYTSDEREIVLAKVKSGSMHC